MQVTVTSDGRLQLTDDGKVYQPLTVEAVELLANSIPAAQPVVDQQAIATSLEAIAYVLSHTADAVATVTMQNSEITMAADSNTFGAMARECSVDSPGTTFTIGPLTVTNTGA